MGFVQSITSCMAKSFDFSGRATRSEFWWFVLLISIIHTVLVNVYNQPLSGFSFKFGFNLNLDISAPWWSNLYTAVFALPFMSVLVRRAHDVGIGGDKIFATLFTALAVFTLVLKAFPTQGTQKWLLILIAGTLLLGFFYVAFRRSQPRTNRFGPNPLVQPHPNEVPS